MPRFAANLGFLFTEHAFLDRFAAARRAGFRAVEFAAPYAYPPEEIAMRLIDNGLECILVNLPMGDRAKGDFGIACRPGREREFREGVARGIEYAQALGVPKLNCISGTATAQDDRVLFAKTLVSNLRLAAREFKAAGLDLVIEPINTKDVPGFFVARSPEAVAIIEEVGADNFGLQCDLYHTAMMGDDPAQTLEDSRARDPPHPVRRCARPRGARHREDRFRSTLRPRRPSRLSGLGVGGIPPDTPDAGDSLLAPIVRMDW